MKTFFLLFVVDILFGIFREKETKKTIIDHTNFPIKLTDATKLTRSSKSFKELILVAKMYSFLNFPGESPKLPFYINRDNLNIILSKLVRSNKFVELLIYFWSAGYCVDITYKAHCHVLGYIHFGELIVCNKFRTFQNIYFVENFRSIIEHSKRAVIVLSKIIKETFEEQRNNDYVKVKRIAPYGRDDLNMKNKEDRIERVVVIKILEIDKGNGIKEYYIYCVNYKNEIYKLKIVIDGGFENIIYMDKKWDMKYIAIIK